ncbi:family 20 glycosylhydrolase [Psychromonas ossibalaenae]|uniref:family 20 glycosylhydrolase n=1 Tax=Psychromonas ossibalaenae TaxID=444922 RepID=UPI00036469D8|nr:family 20 glycosylhydrolase [Psychromonas ossibalaenae]
MKKKTILVAILGSLGLFACNNDSETENIENLPLNEKPMVIPSLSEWESGRGDFTLTAQSKIIVDSVDPEIQETLVRTAQLLSENIKIMSGLELPVVEYTAAEKGDIKISVAGDTPETNALESENYQINIGETLVVESSTVPGAAFATQTIKQILIQDKDGANDIPQGIINDQPKIETRGLMLDLGRRAVSLDFVKDYVKFMAYYKMNDLQLHLNDNQIIWGDSGTPEDGSNWDINTWQETIYHGFRVQIDEYPDLASEDVAYSKEELAELKELATSLGVQLTGEIEAPAHAVSFSRIAPEIKHPDMRPDHLDLSNPLTFEMIENVWDEIYPYFDNVHIGADEYGGAKLEEKLSKEMINYMNHFNEFLKDRGHENIRVWGNTTTLHDLGDTLDKDIVQQIWLGGFADPQDTLDRGFDVINTNDAFYTVPTGNNGYHDTVDPEVMYSDWEANVFSGGFEIGYDNPQFRGAIIALWNDLGWDPDWAYTDADIHVRLRNKVKVAAQKMWAEERELPFDKFQNVAYKLGESPDFSVIYQITENDLASKKPVYASSYKNILYRLGDIEGKLLDNNFLGHPAAVVDGLDNSRWISGDTTANEWIMVDLQAETTINTINISWGVDWAAKYEIELSNDGKSWTTAASVDNAVGNNNDIIEIEPAEARFVRVKMIENATDQPYQIHSIEIFNN